MEYFLGIDYPTLWYLVIGLLFSGYAILEGFDFGAGAWHLFFRKDISRRIAINAIGPVWDANQVWLVIGNVCHHAIGHVCSVYAIFNVQCASSSSN